MFDDARSRRVIILGHCLLNQNTISDGTADFPSQFTELMDLLTRNHIGMIQLPCPDPSCFVSALTGETATGTSGRYLTKIHAFGI